MGHWGLGLEIGGPDANLYFSHGGDNAGFHHNFLLYEKSGNGFVVMTKWDNGNLLADEIMHSVAMNTAGPISGRPCVPRSMSIRRSLQPTRVPMNRKTSNRLSPSRTDN